MLDLVERIAFVFGKAIEETPRIFPFSITLSMDGSVQYVAYYEENDRPDSKDVIEGLIKGNRQRASRGEIKASWIAWMSSITTADKKTVMLL